MTPNLFRKRYIRSKGRKMIDISTDVRKDTEKERKREKERERENGITDRRADKCKKKIRGRSKNISCGFL